MLCLQLSSILNYQLILLCLGLLGNLAGKFNEGIMPLTNSKHNVSSHTTP
jgi:hypothetical protein